MYSSKSQENIFSFLDRSALVFPHCSEMNRISEILSERLKPWTELYWKGVCPPTNWNYYWHGWKYI